MNGSLIIDKPEGMTSHTVVSRVRRAAGTRRVGHTGTLDPFATGLLVVCIGRATRLAQFLSGLDKRYTATVRLGFATDTQDLTGKQITPLRSSKYVSAEDLKRALGELTGPQLQLPPMFSAKKVAGERLYRSARAGLEVEREPVPIMVHSIEPVESEGQLLIDRDGGVRDFIIRVHCSSGTYIRTLAHDIGDKLGVGGHLTALRRTTVGRFGISSALTLEDLEARGEAGALEAAMVTMSETVAHLPELRLKDDEVRRVVNGREIGASQVPEAGPVRLCDMEGALIAVGEYHNESKTVRPKVVLGG